MKVKLMDITENIFAGGDVPKDRFSEVVTDKYRIPIYANAEKDNGLYGYTDTARVSVPCVTVAARGTIGFAAKRMEPFLPVVRLITVIPNEEKITIDYLYYALRNCKPKYSGTSIPQLTVPDIKNYSFEIVPIPRQEEITHILDKVELLIKMQKEQIEEYNLLIKSRFVEMFGDLKKNDMGWPIYPFVDFAQIDTTMIHDLEEYRDYPHIGIDSIEKETGNISGYRTVREDGVISGKYLFTPDHIIYSKIRPNLNKVALPEFKGVCSADAYPILPKKGRCDRIFLAYVMRSSIFLDYILAFSNRTNLPKVNKVQVEGFCCPMPNIALQQEFAAFVHQVDKLKVAVQKSLDETQMLFDSLMQQYFG